MTSELESCGSGGSDGGVARCSRNATAVGQGTIIHFYFFSDLIFICVNKD